MNPFDIGLGVVLILAVLVGMSRGLLRECIALCSWLAAFFIAALLDTKLASSLPLKVDMAILEGLAFLALFIAMLFVGTVVNFVCGLFVLATPLSRSRLYAILPAIFRAGILLLLIGQTILLTPLAAEQGYWSSSWLAALLEHSDSLRVKILPESLLGGTLEEHLPTLNPALPSLPDTIKLEP